MGINNFLLHGGNLGCTIKVTHEKGRNFMLNIALLSNLIKKAQGDRSQIAFAKDCGISAGNLSKIINNKTGQAPLPETLKKIAACSQGGITFDDLSAAAGYNSNTPLSTEEKIDIETKINELKECLSTNRDKVVMSGENLSDEALDMVLDALSFGVRQAAVFNKLEKKINEKNNP